MIALLLAFQQQRFRILDEVLYAYEELHGVGAVNDAVIIGECKVHHRAYRYLAIHGYGPLLNLV
jgi:hypothetical protein